MWDPTSVVTLAVVVYLGYLVVGEDALFNVRKAIHCRLICSLLSSSDDSPEYVHRVLSIMRTLGLLYPDYIYENRGQDWFDTSPFAKAVTGIGGSIIDFFGGSGASDGLGKYKKYSSQELDMMISIFQKPWSEEASAYQKYVYYGALRFGCDANCAGQKKLPAEGSPEYCKESGDPKCE